MHDAGKAHPDRPADQCMTALDGNTRPYNMVLTVADGLRSALEMPKEVYLVGRDKIPK